MNQKIHFIGIGGTGMGPLAKVFLEMDWQVSGSDLKISDTTKYLQNLGAKIYLGHSTENINGADWVVYSSAIPKDNPEYTCAIKNGVKMYHRSELVAKLLNEKRGVAVGGAHGKSTITSMIAWILESAGLDPVVLIGASFAPFGPGAKFGNGDIVVAEADESDRSFLRYHPEITIVTSIEADHLENYNGNFHELITTYCQFLNNTKPNGMQVLCIDDPQIQKIAAKFPNAVTYGFDEKAQWRAEMIETKANRTRFSLYHQGQKFGDFSLKVPGSLYVSNATVAVLVCSLLGLSAETIEQHLAEFSGTERRFQILGETKEGITVVDDYAHHPSEISATLKAIREGWDRRVIAVFQPQRYSRTEFLLDDFSKSFSDADVVVLTDIYAPPPEQPIPGVSSDIMAEMIREHGKEVYLVKDQADLTQFLVDFAKPDDFIITMGAGPIDKTAFEVFKLLTV